MFVFGSCIGMPLAYTLTNWQLRKVFTKQEAIYSGIII